MTWTPKLLRVTLFLEPQADASKLPSWQDLTEQEPETTIRRGLVIQEDGPFGGGRLALGVQLPDRIDVIYVPDAAPSTSDSSSNVDVVVREFALASARLLKVPCGVTRIAVGLQLFWETADRGESYLRLAEAVKIAPDRIAAARDFTYQINRPVSSISVPGISLNRLAKWAAVRAGLIKVDPNLGRVTKAPEANGLLLDLDLSTDVERQTPLEASKLPELYSELVQLGVELSATGDVA